MNRLAKWIMRLYPAAWRARYGDEVDALLADSGSDARVVADLLQGGIRMRISMWSFSKLAPTLAIAGMLAGFGGSFLVTPTYRSVATMQITHAKINPADNPANRIANLNETIQQMETTVLSHTSLSLVVTDSRLELYSDERKTMPMEDVIQKMKRNIRIQFVSLPGRLGRQTSAFDISFTYPDASKAQQTVRALMERFDQQNQAMQAHHGGPGEVLDVLDTASLPKLPVFPDRRSFAVAGLLAGLTMATITATIRRISRQFTMSLPSPTA
jgi:uncharacterized protein involved in exopolysaccharide biosynthesis